MDPNDIEFQYVQELGLGAFAALLPSNDPIMIVEIAPKSAGQHPRVMPLSGAGAFQLRDRDPYFDVPAMSFSRIRFEVNPDAVVQLGRASGPDCIGGLFVSKEQRGIYAVAGAQGIPKAINLQGEHVSVPADGLLFPEWSIVSGEGENRVVHWTKEKT